MVSASSVIELEVEQKMFWNCLPVPICDLFLYTLLRKLRIFGLSVSEIPPIEKIETGV